MKIRIACPSCKKPIQFAQELLGRKIQCPLCKAVSVVGAPKQPDVAPAAGPAKPIAQRPSAKPREARPTQPATTSTKPTAPVPPTRTSSPITTASPDPSRRPTPVAPRDERPASAPIQSPPIFHTEDEPADMPLNSELPGPSDPDSLNAPEPALAADSAAPDMAQSPARTPDEDSSSVSEFVTEDEPAVPPLAARTPDPVAAGLSDEDPSHGAQVVSRSPTPPVHDPILSAGVLGRFQIREVLGQGAFGTVYRAFDPVLDRDVALKTPRAGVTDAEHAARLIDEAKAAAKLRHPNIVAVYEAGAAGDDLFIASEYVAGQSLAERLRRDRIEPRQAAEWVLSLAEALGYAHGQGVVHRDVKPQNVMLNSDGRVQLMDFGLATRADAAIPFDKPAPGAAAGVVGTPVYMSPEQASGQNAGPAGDQYSLGVVLYELLTGRTPFGSESSGGTASTSEILTKVREQSPPRVRSIRRHVARDLASVCEKAIARDPRRRYSNCQEFANDLGRWLAGDLVRAHRYSPPELAMYWARRHPAAFGWIAAAACLLFALLGAGVTVGVQALASNGSGSRPMTTPIVQREMTRTTDGPDVAASVEPASSDSENVEAEVLTYARLLDRARGAYHAHEIIKADEFLEQTRWDYRDWEYAYLRRLITGGWRTFHGHRMAVTAVAFSPNGQRVASASADGTVRVWNVVTGDEFARLQHDSAVTGVAFSADGKHVFTTVGLIEQAHSMFGPGGPMAPMPAPVEARRSRPHAGREDYLAPSARAVAESIQAARAGRDGRLALAQEPAVGVQPMPRVAPQMRYRIQVWGAESGERIGEFERLAPQTPLVSLALSPDGTKLATASIAAPSPQNPNGPGGPRPGVLPVPQAERIPAPATCDPTSDDTGTEQSLAQQAPPPVQGPGGAPGPMPGPAMAPPAGDIELWDVATRKLVRTIPTPQGPPRQVAWSADGKFVGAIFGRAGGLGGFASWDAATGQAATALPGDFAALAFSIEGNQLAAAPTQHLSLLEQGRRRSEGPDSEIRLWRFLQLGMRQSPNGPPMGPIPATPGQPVPDKSAPGEPAPGEVTEAAPQVMMPPVFPNEPDTSVPLAGLPAAARSLAFAPSDALTAGYGQAGLAVAGGDALLVEREGNIRLWHPKFDAMGHADLWGHTGRVNAVAYRADGKQIVTGGADGLVKVWTTEVAPEVIRLQEYMSATRVAFSRDGRFLAVGHRAKHWTASRGFGEFAGRPMPPGGGPGGERVPDPDNLKIYDVRNGRELSHLAAPGGDVVGLVFHPRGEWLAAATADGRVTIWNLASSEVIATLQAPAPLACLDVSPDGEFLAGGCMQAASTREGMPAPPGGVPPQPAMPAPAAPVPSPPGAPQAAMPGNPFVLTSLERVMGGATGEQDANESKNGNTPSPALAIVIWRVADKSVASTIPVRSDAAPGTNQSASYVAGGIVAVAFSTDGKRLASSGPDENVRLWDIETKSELRVLEPHDGQVVDLAFRPGSDEIAGAVLRQPCRPGYPGDVVVWDAATGKKRLVIAAHAEAAYSVAYSRDGRRLASCGGAAEGSLSQPGEVKVWHADTGIELLPLAGSAGRDTKQGHQYKEEAYTVMKPVYETVTKEIEQDGKKVPIVEKHMRMVPETKTRKVGGNSRVWWEVPGAATDVAFSDDGYRLAASCEDGTARIWDGFICQPHDSTRAPGFSPSAIATGFKGMMCAPSEAQIAATSDGRWVVVVDSAGDRCDSIAGMLRVFDAKTGRLVREVGPLDSFARGISISSNNRWVAVALVGVQMGAPMVRQPDGSFKQSAEPARSRGGRVDVWDITTGERVSEFTGHEGAPSCVAFDPAGERVVSGGPDGLRLWDAKSGSEIKAAKTAMVSGIAWSSDRNVLFVTQAGHSARTAAANLPNGVERPDALERAWFPLDEAPPIADSGRATQPVRFVSLSSQSPPAKGLGVWDVNEDAPPRSVKSLGGNFYFAPRPLAFDAATGRAIVACTLQGANGDERGQLQFIPLDKPDNSQLLTIGRGMLWSVATSSDGKRLVTVGSDWCVNVWDTERRSRLLHLGGHIDDVRGAVFLPDGRVASVGADHQLKVWRAGEAADRMAACHEIESPRKRTTKFRSPAGNISRMIASRSAPLAATVEIMQQQRRGWQHPVRAFNPKTGADGPPWPGHTDTVRGVAVRPDGEQVASCAQDMYVVLWKADNSDKIDVRHSNKVMHVVYSPDGKRVASSTAFDGKVWIWDAATGQPVRDFQADPTTTFALAYSPNGDLLATGGIGRAVALRKAETGEVVRTLEGHADTVQHVTFSRDGRWLASASHDKTAKLWNVETGELVRTFDGFTAQVWETAFSPDDRLIAVGGWEPTVRIFEVESGKLVKELSGHDRGVWSVAFSPDGEQLAACGREQPMIVWNWQRSEKLFTAEAAGECLTYFPDGSRIVTGNVLAMPQPQQQKFNSIVRVWNTETSKPRGSLTLEGVQVVDVAVTRDGTRVAAAGQDGSVHLWEGRANEDFPPEATAHFRASDRPTWSVAFSADGGSIATASHDDVVRVWTARGEAQFELKPAGGPRRLAFHPNGQQLAIGCADRSVRVWSLTTKQETAVFKRHYGDVSDLEYSPDGSRLAVTSRRYDGERQRWTGDLKVWDVATGRRIVSTPAHSWWDARLAFHSTQPHVLITGLDHTVQVRHAETGQLVLSVPTQGHMIGSLAFSPAGDRLMFARGGEVLMVDSTPEPSPFGSAPKPVAAAATQSAADEAAARWVLDKGGRVHVRSDGVVDEVANAADLPTDPYIVTAVLLGGRPEIKDADVAVLDPLEHLTTLHLNLPGISDAAFEGLASLKNLRAIHAEGSQSTGSFLAAFRGRKQLQHLSLAGSKLSDAGVQNLAGNELIGCSVYDTAIGDAAMSVLKQAVTGGLSIARTKLTDAGLAQLAGFRGNNLTIDGTAVTDSGLRTFLASKPPLHHLSIAHTAATDAIIDSIAEIKTLQSVSVQGTKITPEAAARLKAALPNCNVHH